MEEFSYPLQAINADVSMPKSIKRVSFPASPKTLGGFGRCEFDTLIIPASIEKIENHTFYESKIGFLDMSMCGIVEICGNKLYDEIFKDVEIGTFKAPKRATRVPLSLSRVKEAFFYTLERPKCLDLSYTNGIIHIPRGSKAGWGANEHIIDDIEE